MIEARFAAPASLLKNLADVLKDIVKEINFDMAPGGVSMQAMDSSHVSLVMLDLPATGFAHYKCSKECRIGVSLDALTKVLRCCGNEDVVTIHYDDANKADTLTFLFENQRGDRISDFTLKLMDIDQEIMSLPEVEYPASFAMSSFDFQKICRDLKEIDDVLQLTVGKDGVKFAVEGALGSGCVTARPATEQEMSDSAVNVNFTASTAIKLSLRYLIFFAKAASVATRVRAEVSGEMPAAVHYDMDTCGRLSFYLAPKMDDL